MVPARSRRRHRGTVGPAESRRPESSRVRREHTADTRRFACLSIGPVAMADDSSAKAATLWPMILNEFSPAGSDGRRLDINGFLKLASTLGLRSRQALNLAQRLVATAGIVGGSLSQALHPTAAPDWCEQNARSSCIADAPTDTRGPRTVISNSRPGSTSRRSSLPRPIRPNRCVMNSGRAVLTRKKKQGGRWHPSTTPRLHV